jgi:glycosyltransferase involved in cell wall biosynthesis
MTISILLPTRKRVSQLKKSMDSLLSNAKNPDKIQPLFGVDDDDTETLEFLKTTNYQNQSVLKFKRLGYQNLHMYNNSLCAYAQGTWVMFFNDDAIMNTKHWDEIIEAEKNFNVLRVKEQTGHPYSIFPIFPWDWFRLLDHISLHGQNDAWISEIAYMLDIMKDVDIEVIHDRADITGNNNDSVFKERVYKEGHPDQEGDLHHVKMWNARTADASKLAWYLEKIGQTSLHWKKIVRKEIEPLHLVANKFDEYRKRGAIGAGKQDARTDTEGTIKVSYSTIPGNEGSSGS